MDQKIKDMMEKIMDTERMGYAYVYPSDKSATGKGHPREEYLIATTPENMANFIGNRFPDTQKIVITDILDTCGGFIDTCSDQKLCMETNSHLVPIQIGEREAGEEAHAYPCRCKEWGLWNPGNRLLDRKRDWKEVGTWRGS